jgi:bifunctional DNA-binding transcriptional regulator/antitoxin component of YhaV-PrlF toxin-antitoxin module
MDEVITIRQRGQITLPKKIRDSLDWLIENSVIGIKATETEICISPYRESKKPIDWKNIWNQIELSRSFKGKRGNLSEFIAEDRQSH